MMRIEKDMHDNKVKIQYSGGQKGSDRREVVVREVKMTSNVKDIESVELDEKNGPLQQSKWLAYLFPRSSFHKSY